MKGYFDALLRSTGVGTGGSVPSGPHAGPGVVELDQKTRAETMAPRAAQTTDRLEAGTTEERARQSEPSPVAPVTQGASITPVASVPPAARAAHPARQSPVEPVAAPASATATADEAPADLGRAMVRAAMRWVAADVVAQQADAPIVDAQVPRHEVITHRDVDATARVQKLTDDLPSQRLGHAEAAAPPAWPDPTVRLVTTTPALIPAPPLSPAPVMRDEIFDVSIGAIHVRVDAPPAQTVTRPQPTPPAVTSRAGATSPRRSALSRRALRRI